MDGLFTLLIVLVFVAAAFFFGIWKNGREQQKRRQQQQKEYRRAFAGDRQSAQQVSKSVRASERPKHQPMKESVSVSSRKPMEARVGWQQPPRPAQPSPDPTPDVSGAREELVQAAVQTLKKAKAGYRGRRLEQAVVWSEILGKPKGLE